MDAAKLLIQIASWYSQLGKLTEAQDIFERAEKIINSCKASKTASEGDLAMASLLNNRGFMHSERGHVEEALKDFNNSVTLRKKHEKEDTLALASLYNNIGSVYGGIGDHEKAFEFYEKGFED